jgi:hypothetical protein
MVTTLATTSPVVQGLSMAMSVSHIIKKTNKTTTYLG